MSRRCVRVSPRSLKRRMAARTRSTACSMAGWRRRAPRRRRRQTTRLSSGASCWIWLAYCPPPKRCRRSPLIVGRTSAQVWCGRCSRAMSTMPITGWCSGTTFCAMTTPARATSTAAVSKSPTGSTSRCWPINLTTSSHASSSRLLLTARDSPRVSSGAVPSVRVRPRSCSSLRASRRRSLAST